MSKCKSYGPCWSLVIGHAHTLHPRKYYRHPSELTYIYIYVFFHWPLSARGHHTSFWDYPAFRAISAALPRTTASTTATTENAKPTSCLNRPQSALWRPHTTTWASRRVCKGSRGVVVEACEAVAVRSKKKSSRQAARWRVASEADAIQPATKVGWGWCDVAPQAGVGFFGAGQPTECHHFYKSEYCGRCTVLLTRSVTDAVSLIRTSSQKNTCGRPTLPTSCTCSVSVVSQSQAHHVKQVRRCL